MTCLLTTWWDRAKTEVDRRAMTRALAYILNAQSTPWRWTVMIRF